MSTSTLMDKALLLYFLVLLVQPSVTISGYCVIPESPGKHSQPLNNGKHIKLNTAGLVKACGLFRDVDMSLCHSSGDNDNNTIDTAQTSELTSS